MAAWDWGPSGVITVIIYGCLNLWLGHYAYLIAAAESGQRADERLLAELSQAHAQLAEFAAERRQVAAEAERHRLARELHDSVTQSLFSMNLAIQGARLLLPTEPARAGEQIALASRLAIGAGEEVNRLAGQLQGETPTEVSLVAALRRLAAERTSRDGLRLALELAGERRLPPAEVAGLYRIAQEALNNVARHAGTAEASIRLDLDADPPYLEIEDAGRGFDPELAANLPGHGGLAGMAERAEELGWRLTVSSRPGQGARVRTQRLAGIQPAGDRLVPAPMAEVRP
jgi:signal transduction histidine kinase